ncbi:MAG: hypothetical protein H7X77_03505 [Anaerolineae bacterium]|nr:hypothetical protein [Anaerolineae bacterium]
MSSWHSLYLPSTDTEQIASTLKTSLTASGHTLYDPFGVMPGSYVYKQAVKAFVAPPQGNWTRLLLAADTPLPAINIIALSSIGFCLAVSLVDQTAEITVYVEGQLQDDALEALSACLKLPPGDLRAAMTTPGGQIANRTSNIIPLQGLSDDVQTMAAGLNPRQTQKMFDKISSKLLKGDQQSAARELLQSGTVDWSSAGGQQISTLMQALAIPHWLEPDYVALRDAYQLHNRRRRNPNASLYPGDAEAMAAVPDALNYSPVFAGK